MIFVPALDSARILVIASSHSILALAVETKTDSSHTLTCATATKEVIK